ncbi:unnamed protein product [Chondrus crispus]|uniref:Peptidase S49 domain-containing protein n=1 Tax=Chondrus crispus TaxID=2769 RepID=R7Q5F9_CHOCR|nr:unnamed protein product [Chondrus crispus]CDF33259.1 unnamed protein product [Chondrus crispus]|eukprot:XP_005713062.1 unnamed protein product [Chondrus crispus]
MLRQVRGRVSKGTVLTARIGGAMSESDAPSGLPFSGPPELTLPVLLNALRVGAHDPRIAHLHLRIDALACGWAKVFEMRRHLDYFRASGKGITVFMETGGPKEFFLGMGFALYVAPEGGLGLRGFAASGSYVGGVLEKIGVAPQVERIGKYKSAGDQLARRDMAPAQREVINSLLGETHNTWTKSVCEAIGISESELAAFVDRSPWEMNEYVEAGLITGICYESDVEDQLKIRFGKGPFKKEEEVVKQPLNSVDVRRYVRRNTEKMVGIGGGKKIAVIRAVGAITSGKNGSSPVTGNTLGSESLVELIRKVRDDKRYVACLLRCDSPGGSALASDIMWSELKKLAAVKPVLASQSDVAASGGYYISMACEIIAEPLTITGSVGVVTVKPSLGELYRKIGYTKENISVGSKYAELLVDDRPFTEEESEYYRDGAMQAYKKFVNKAAQSRGKTYEEMHAVAQGRVWTGLQAKQQGLVDYLGGIGRGVEILKEKAKLGADEYVRLDVVRNPVSLAARLGLKSASTQARHEASVMASLRQPLALAEVDASLGGLSPLTRFVVDATLAPLSQNFGFWTNRMPALETILRTLLRDA